MKDEQQAPALRAEGDNRECGGQFYISSDGKPGGDVGRFEKIIGEELDKLLAEGPTEAEMTRLRTSTVASFVRSLESISGKASLLAESQTYLGSPDGWQAGFARYRAATPKQLQDAGRKRSEEHTSELQSLMRISYAVFGLK